MVEHVHKKRLLYCMKKGVDFVYPLFCSYSCDCKHAHHPVTIRNIDGRDATPATGLITPVHIVLRMSHFKRSLHQCFTNRVSAFHAAVNSHTNAECAS